MNNRQNISSLKITYIILKAIFWIISLFLIFNLMVFIKAWIVLPHIHQVIKENLPRLFLFFYLLAFVAWLCNRYAKIIKNNIKILTEKGRFDEKIS